MFEIVLDGPGKNALGSALLATLRERLAEADGRPVLLTGAGDAFSAGLDLKEVASLDNDGMLRFLAGLEATCRALFTYPAPTVALVNGHAIAGGCILALCCDWRVAAPNPRAKIGLNEVALGLRFPPGLLRMMRQRVPAQHATRVFLEAGLFDPATALGLGLVDELADDARTVAIGRLERLATSPAAAYAGAKRDLQGPIDVSADEERRFEQEVVPAWTSPDLKARLLAALKR